MLTTVWTFAKEVGQKAIIAYSAYQLGDANNDHEKITNAVIKATNAQVNNNFEQSKNDNNNEFLTYGFVTIIILLILISISLLARLLITRAVKNDRRIRNIARSNTQNETSTV